MKKIRNLLYLIIFILALAAGTLFVVQNTAEAPLDLLILQLPEQRIALWVVLAFALGGLIGMLTSFGLVLRLRTALMRAHRQLRNAQANPASGD